MSYRTLVDRSRHSIFIQINLQIFQLILVLVKFIFSNFLNGVSEIISSRCCLGQILPLVVY
jgi:hypothetical protein